MTADELHEAACSEGKTFYLDPDTGHRVFTETFLEERGYCCHTGCRHCPYGFIPTDLTKESK